MNTFICSSHPTAECRVSRVLKGASGRFVALEYFRLEGDPRELFSTVGVEPQKVYVREDGKEEKVYVVSVVAALEETP